jgi:hypothetical protein
VKESEMARRAFVEQSQGVRQPYLVDLREVGAVADRKHGARLLPATVHRQHRRLIEARDEVGRCRVRHVVLDEMEGRQFLPALDARSEAPQVVRRVVQQEPRRVDDAG